MKITVVGGYGVGMTMRLDHSPVAGETVTGGVLSSGPGGKGSNQAIGCARLGAQVSLFTAVGADDSADNARALWAAEGVDASPVVTKAAPSMTGFILVDAIGENRIAIAPGALELIDISDLDGLEATVAASAIMVVSLEIPVEVAEAALAMAHHAGVRTVLNPAPASILPPSIWASVDYLTPNATEGNALLGRAPGDYGAESTAAELRARFGVTVAMTRGNLPTLVESGTGSFAVDTLPVDRAVDTTGAGDAFTAAFAVALADGLELEDAVRFANACGAFTVRTREVVPALPRRADVEQLLAQHGSRKVLN